MSKDKGKSSAPKAGEASGKKGKKPYAAPRLVEYGDLRKIVMSKASTRNDNTGGPATKR